MGPQSSCREPCLSAWADELLRMGREAWSGCGLLWVFALIVGSQQGKAALFWVKERQGCLSLAPVLLPSPIHIHPKGHQAVGL